MFVLYRNTKDRVDNEHEAEVMDQMYEDGEPMDYGDFVNGLEGIKELEHDLGYDKMELTLEEDWHVGFCESKYGGLPCRYLTHSECDFIFLRSEDAKMLQEQFTQDIPDTQWERATRYGRGAVDQRFVEEPSDES